MRNRVSILGQKSAAEFLKSWLADKRNIVLVSGSGSYAKCGAEVFFAPFLSDKNVLHLTTVGENARAEDVEEKSRAIATWGVPDAFIAVGGGTVIDTTKLLRCGFPPLSNSNSKLQLLPPPFLAVPTTAGTGAEATRFAVYYDRGTKCSADDVRYLPTDVVLISEFTETQSPYQRASTEFDAYAQAVESLWAKGATEESKGYAKKALSLFSETDSARQLEGAYWAGRAIDISRTTAAHAFSYYLTSHYGIPHGHAVYMVFEYVCRNNNHPEYIKIIPELKTLREFAAENGLGWNELVEALFANVNLNRLGNNPVEVRKESFCG